MVFALKNFEKALVLLCFRSKMLNKQRFYLFSLTYVGKPWVLLCFRSKNAKRWKNHGFYYEKIKKSKNHYKTKLKPKRRVVKPTSSYGSGVWITNTRWRNYEEPLQPSCFSKNKKRMQKKNKNTGVCFLGVLFSCCCSSLFVCASFLKKHTYLHSCMSATEGLSVSYVQCKTGSIFFKCVFSKRTFCQFLV